MYNDALLKNSKLSMLVVSKMLGRLGKSALIYPVRFVGSTADVEFSPKLYAFNVLAVTLLTICGWVSLLNEVSLFWQGQSSRINSASIAALALAHFLILSSSSLMTVFGSTSRYNTLLEIERVLIRIDQALDGPTADKRVEWFAVYLVVHLALLFSMDFYMWMNIDSSNKSFTLAYAFHYINFISLAMYAQIAWSIGHRFDSINREIDAKLERLTATNCTELVTRKYHDLSDLIQCSNCYRYDIKYISFAKFQEFYWSLCHCIEMMNQQYGWQLLLGLLQNVINLITTPYVLIVQILNPEKWGPPNTKVIAICIAWLLTHLLYLFSMIIPTSYAATKVIGTTITFLVIFIQFQNHT